MVEINNEYIRDMPHNAVVQRLKECPQGQETVIVVQRGGMYKDRQSMWGVKWDNLGPM